MQDQNFECDSLYIPHQDQHPVAKRKELVEMSRIPASHRRMAWEHLQAHHPEKARSLEVLRGIKPDKPDPFVQELMMNFGAQVVIYAEDLPKEVVSAYRVSKAARLLDNPPGDHLPESAG